MAKVLLEQFIYGKFGLGEGGYQVIACSDSLSDKLLGRASFDVIIKKYKFWKEQPVNPGHHNAIGIFLNSRPGDSKPELPEPYSFIIAQVQPPLDEIGEIKKLERYFYQCRYLFLEEQDIDAFHYRLPEILYYLTNPKRRIPCQIQGNQSSESRGNIPKIDPLEIRISQEDLNEEKSSAVEFIREIVADSRGQELGFILGAISYLVNYFNDPEAQLVIAHLAESKIARTVYQYIQCIYLLLPEIYRSQLSLVIGYSDVHTYKPVKVVISLLGDDRPGLPDGCNWIDQERKICSNVDNSTNKNLIGYIISLRSFLEGRPSLNEINRIIDALESEAAKNLFLTDSVSSEEMLKNPNQVLTEHFFDRLVSIGSNTNIIKKEFSKLLEERAKGVGHYPNSASFLDNLTKVCNLELDPWENLGAQLDNLQKTDHLDAVIKFIDILIGSKIWDNESIPKLVKLNRLKNDSHGLSFSLLINYTQDQPDSWENFHEFANDNFNSSNNYIDFIDSALGCSKAWEETYFPHVLLYWMKHPDLSKQYYPNSSKNQLNLQRILQDIPINYIFVILDFPEVKNDLHLMADLITEYLPDPSENSDPKLIDIRSRFLENVTKSEDFSNLLFELVGQGFFDEIHNKEAQILAQRILLVSTNIFNYAIVYFRKIDLPIISGSLKSFFESELKKAVLKNLKVIVESDESVAGYFLDNCHGLSSHDLWLNSSDLFNILKLGLDLSKNNLPVFKLLIHKFFSWKLHEEFFLINGNLDLVKGSNFLKLILTTKAENIAQDDRALLISFLCRILELNTPSLEILKFHDLDSQEAQLYRDNFRQACLYFAGTHPEGDVSKLINSLKDKGLNEEKEELGKICNSYRKERRLSNRDENTIAEQQIAKQQYSENQIEEVKKLLELEEVKKLLELEEVKKLLELEEVKKLLELLELLKKRCEITQQEEPDSLTDSNNKIEGQGDSVTANEKKNNRQREQSLRLLDESTIFEDLFPTFSMLLVELSRYSFLRQLFRILRIRINLDLLLLRRF